MLKITKNQSKEDCLLRKTGTRGQLPDLVSWKACCILIQLKCTAIGQGWLASKN